jgi:hypothetical protein
VTIGRFGPVRSRSPARRNLLTHLTAAVIVPGCLALGWWQVTRAVSGNTLSWAYVFEWPIFAGYAVFMWWKLTHDQGSPVEPAPDATSTGPGSAAGDGPGDAAIMSEEDEELASYNRYLASLHASDEGKDG